MPEEIFQSMILFGLGKLLKYQWKDKSYLSVALTNNHYTVLRLILTKLWISTFTYMLTIPNSLSSTLILIPNLSIGHFYLELPCVFFFFYRTHHLSSLTGSYIPCWNYLRDQPHTFSWVPHTGPLLFPPLILHLQGVTKPFLIFLLHFSVKSLLNSQCPIRSSGRSLSLDHCNVLL